MSMLDYMGGRGDPDKVVLQAVKLKSSAAPAWSQDSHYVRGN
jgi:hypothetical protein